MSLTKIERETVIVFNEEEEFATISTFNTKIKSTLRDVYKVIAEDSEGCVTIEIPKSMVNIRKPRKALTEEQKIASAQRLDEARKKYQESIDK